MPTVTYQPDGTTGIDTYLNNTAPSSNFSTSIHLQAGERDDLASDFNRPLIKFDLSGIPRTARIIRADLTLVVDTERSSFARDHKVYRLLRNWVLGQATWTDYSTGNAWAAGGAGSAGSDYDSTVWATVNLSATEAAGAAKVFSLSVAEFQKLINGTYPNYGWLIRVDTETNDGILYGSSNHGTAARRPQLVVEYAMSGASPMIAPFGKL